ncbi:hypothetical protein EYR40_001652 [Pleurotus pulmonarius]|nr:hypothetical protein EYR40_001652 [Pleurotus pulmonarius]
MARSTSSNENDAYPDAYYALVHAYDGIQHTKRSTRLLITPAGLLHDQHPLPPHASPPFDVFLAAGAGEDASPAAGPPDTSADFVAAPQELFNTPPAATELHTSSIAQDEHDDSPPLRFEAPPPFVGDHDDPNTPLRPPARQEHDKDADAPDFKVILSSEAPAPSPVVQGTQRKAPAGASSPPCTSSPPAFTIHPTLISPVPTSDASSLPFQSSSQSSQSFQSALSLLPTAVAANTTSASTSTSTGAPFALSTPASAPASRTPAPTALGALHTAHTVPFYVSVVFGCITAAALLAALVAWAVRFRSAARVRREERIFGGRGVGSGGRVLGVGKERGVDMGRERGRGRGSAAGRRGGAARS